MTDWVRLWHDMPSDPKWRVIARKSKQKIGDVIATYAFMLVNASANGAERGRLKGFNIEDVGAALDLDESDAGAILDAMEGRVVKDGWLTGWETRNPKREDQSTARVRAFRERKKEGCNAQEHIETTRNAPEQSRADTEQKASQPRGEMDTTNFHRVCALLNYDANDFRNWTSFTDMVGRDGLDFERHVWPEAQRKAKSANKGRSMGYLRAGAIEAREAEKRSGEIPAPPIDWPSDGDAGWMRRVEIWRGKGTWLAKWGPGPGDPGCKVPAHVLAEIEPAEAAE